MILVASNIPMYLVGAEHPNKAAAARSLEQAILNGEPPVTDAEVIQEILRRYVAIDSSTTLNAVIGARRSGRPGSPR